MSRTFNLGEVLSVSTGRVLTERYKIIVGYMWDTLCDSPIEYIAMAPEAKLWILKQYPKFSEEILYDQCADLDSRLLNQPSSMRKPIVLGWVAEQAMIFGNKFSVNPIPPQNRRSIDIVEETMLIVPQGRIISFD